MGLFKILASLLLTFSLSFSVVVVWRESTIEIRVPRNSIVTIELPCIVEGVAKNSLVDVQFKANSVFVSVGEVPTSIGISCRKGNVYRSYSFYLFPGSSGIVYVKVRDPKLFETYLEERLEGYSEGISGEGETPLTLRAKKLLSFVLRGKIPSGYEVLKAKGKKESLGGWEFEHEYYVVGNSVFAVVGNLKNTSYMQKRLDTSVLFGKGTVLVWVENEEDKWLSPGERRKVVIVKLKKGAFRKEGTEVRKVIPYR